MRSDDAFRNELGPQQGCPGHFYSGVMAGHVATATGQTLSCWSDLPSLSGKRHTPPAPATPPAPPSTPCAPRSSAQVHTRDTRGRKHSLQASLRWRDVFCAHQNRRDRSKIRRTKSKPSSVVQVVKNTFISFVSCVYILENETTGRPMGRHED